MTAAPVSSLAPYARDLLKTGSDLLAQAYGPHVSKAVADDAKWHPARAAQMVGTLAYADPKFRAALAGNNLHPDLYALTLHDAGRNPHSRSTMLGQLAEIYS